MVRPHRTEGILVAQHQRLKLAEENLVSRNVDFFLPREEISIVVHGRHVREYRPIFGNYILIAITAAWKSLMRMRGVAGILMNESDYPARVLPHEVEWIKAQCVNGVYRPRMIESQRGFTYGQRVTPIEGPFAYHVGRYDHRTKRGDTALFVLFGQEQKVTFKPGDLIAA